MTEPSIPDPHLPSELTARGKPPRPRRLPLLVGFGILIITTALVFRFSGWGHEFQLRRASLETLRTWAAAKPRDPLLYYHLATKAYAANSLAEAGACYQTAVNQAPRMAKAYLGLALVQRSIEAWPQAYESAKKAQEIDPRDVDTQLVVGDLVMHASRARAIPEFQRATQLAPGRADGWYWLGVCNEEINQRAEALTALRKAVALEPGNAVYQRDLGKVLMETNFFAEARSALERAHKADGRDPQTNFLLGEVRLKTAQSDQDLRDADRLFAEAQAALASVTGADPASLAQVLGERAQAAKRLRKPQEALNYLEMARKLAPRGLKYLYDEAEVLRLAGQEQRARAMMTEYSRLSLGVNSASQLIERIKQDPKQPSLRLKLARVFARNRDYPRAVNQYEYCLYLDPKQEDARRELNALKKRLGAPSNAGQSGTPAAAR